MKVIINVTYSIQKYPRLICFYIINILFPEDSIVMQLLNKDEKKCWGKQTANTALVSLEEIPYTEQVDLIMSNAR